MKKMFPLALVALLALPLVAQEEETKAEEETPAAKVEQKDFSAVWPAFLAVSQWPRSADVIGLRLTIPFATSQESVTGLDLGFWGKATYFEGLQVNVLRNHVVDSMAGFQAGIYNTVGRGDMLGIQLGFFNEAQSFRGVQAGLINVVGEAEGFQIGIINRAETLHGYQIGIFNVNRAAELQFMPICNIGF